MEQGLGLLRTLTDNLAFCIAMLHGSQGEQGRTTDGIGNYLG